MGYLYVAISLFCSITFLVKQKEKINMASGLVAGNVFFALIPILLVPIFGEIDAEGLPMRNFAGPSQPLGFYILLFSIALIFAAVWPHIIFKKRRVNATVIPHTRPPDIKEFQYIWIITLTFLITFFFNSGKLSGNHWANYAESGFLGSLVGLAFISLRAYIFALSILVLPQRPKHILFLLMIFTSLDVILTGNRITVLYFGFAVFFSGAFKTHALLVLGFLIAPAAYFFAVLYPAFRGVVWSQFGGFSGFGDAFWYVWHSSAEYRHDTSKFYGLFEAYNIVLLQYIFDTFGEVNQFLYGETVIFKPMTFFIPREFWTEKPIGLSVRLGQEIFAIDGLSLNSLLLGEFYANFGWFSPFFVFILPGVTKVLIRIFNIVDDQRFQGAAFILAFSCWRHEFNYFVYGFCTLALIILLTRKMNGVRPASNETLLSPDEVLPRS